MTRKPGYQLIAVFELEDDSVKNCDLLSDHIAMLADWFKRKGYITGNLLHTYVLKDRDRIYANNRRYNGICENSVVGFVKPIPSDKK